MRKLLLLLIATFSFFGSSAQWVRVLDKNTKRPIDFVYIFNTYGSSTTDPEGRADITPLGPDTASIYFQHPGYKTLEFTRSELKRTDFVVLLPQTELKLSEITVAANRWEKSTDQLPNQLAVVDRKEIKFQNPQTAADLLDLSGQVFIQKSQMGGGSPMIRGFATSRVLLVVDGVRMNNAIFREGNVQNVISLDPLSIKSTEILFGPGSVIYGSDALGGVMTFNTLKPQFQQSSSGLTELNATLRTASANFEKTGHFDLNLGGEKIAAVSSFTYTDYDDLIMGSHGPESYLRPEYQDRVNGVDVVVGNRDPKRQVATGYSQYNLMQKVAFKPNDHWYFEGAIHHSATSDIPRYDRLIQYRNGDLRFGDWYYGPQKWTMGKLDVDHKAPTLLYNELKVTTAFQRFEESRYSRAFGDNILEGQQERVDAWSINLDLRKVIAEGQRMYYGGEILLNQVSSTARNENINSGESTPAGTRYPDGSTWKTAAAYANYEMDLSSKWFLSAGARFTQVWIDASFDPTFYQLPFGSAQNRTGALNGMLGATYRPFSDTKIYMNLSTGFRAPNIDDIGKVFDSGDQIVVVPNTDLNAEYLYNAEAGILRTWKKRFQIEATAFVSFLSDAMARRPTTLNGMDSIIYRGDLSQVNSIQNVDQAFIAGAFLRLSADLNEHFSTSLEGTYTYGEASDGEPLRHVAPFFGRASVFFKHGWFKADLYAIYNGELTTEQLAPSELDKPYLYATDDNGDPYSPSWWTLNLKASYPVHKNLELSGGIENILDQRYRPYSSGIVAAGRNFILALRLHI
ncbi:MAG: TonB-dependent receptor [Bacteroidota bacterium]|nr:TonB-dependent receptor [Bacteroidota bacterium]